MATDPPSLQTSQEGKSNQEKKSSLNHRRSSSTKRSLTIDCSTEGSAALALCN